MERAQEAQGRHKNGHNGEPAAASINSRKELIICSLAGRRGRTRTGDPLLRKAGFGLFRKCSTFNRLRFTQIRTTY
jgi:hypothetical protein